MIAIPGRIAIQASQARIDPTSTLELPNHLGFVELVDSPGGKEGTAATQTFQTPGYQHQTRRVSIKPMHQMVIPTPTLQSGDQRILQMRIAAGLRQQPRRFQNHQQPWIVINNLQALRARASPGSVFGKGVQPDRDGEPVLALLLPPYVDDCCCRALTR